MDTQPDSVHSDVLWEGPRDIDIYRKPVITFSQQDKTAPWTVVAISSGKPSNPNNYTTGLARRAVKGMKSLIAAQRSATDAIRAVEKEQQRRRNRMYNTRHRPGMLNITPLRAIPLQMSLYTSFDTAGRLIASGKQGKGSKGIFFDPSISSMSGRIPIELGKSTYMKDVWNMSFADKMES